MFTGIIEAVVPILAVREGSGRRHIKLSRPQAFDDLRAGASIACDGICLTVLGFDQSSFEVEVMAETLKKTIAAGWRNGTLINLERALRLGDRLDGHLVQGHIDRVLTLNSTRNQSDTLYLYFHYPREDAALLVAQGSVCLNGVSLTIAELKTDSFAVALISHTRQNSNLPALKPGSRVNVEYDVLGKYILRSSNPLKLSEEWLREQGY